MAGQVPLRGHAAHTSWFETHSPQCWLTLETRPGPRVKAPLPFLIDAPVVRRARKRWRSCAPLRSALREWRGVLHLVLELTKSVTNRRHGGVQPRSWDGTMSSRNASEVFAGWV